MAVIKGITVYIPLYDKWGNSIGQIELEPRLVDGLPKQGSRKGELIFNTQNNGIYYWDGERWRELGAAATTITRDDVVDFWAEPFWDNIPDKPSQFPPEPHTHPRSDITDFFNSPFWNNIPDKPSAFPPAEHNHDDRYYTKSQLQTSGQASVHWDNVTNKPSTYPPSSHTHTRSQITDFWSTPFWDNIPDKPEVAEAFYSTTDDLSDVTIHKIDDSKISAGEFLTLFNITDEVKLLCGFASANYLVQVGYQIDGADWVYQNCFRHRDDAADFAYSVVIPPVHATSSLWVTVERGSSTEIFAGAMAVTKCPFLDEKKPNILFDVDKKTGEIHAIHGSQRVIDKSGYIPPEGCKHVHLIGEYELDQLPKDVPPRYLRYKDGKFERAKWGYVFRKEVSILGQKQVLWEKTFEFDRELSQEEIKQIEEQLGAKLVRVI